MYVCVYLQLKADDVDSQLNGAVLYSIVSGDRHNQFLIDPLSGVIKVNKQLDRETVRTHFYIEKHPLILCAVWFGEIIGDRPIASFIIPYWVCIDYDVGYVIG